MSPRVLRALLASLSLAAAAVVGFMPSPASAASGWTSLSSGENHTCGIRGGRVYCWGQDTNGQLGDGVADSGRSVAAPIASGATDWTSVSAGAFHTCAIRIGRVACWGYDGFGQLGDGTASGTPDPTPGFIASGATDWTSVSAGGNHTCAIRSMRVACWGFDASGQLGDGTADAGADASPGFISSGATDWTSVSAGTNHTCAIRSNRVACWGGDIQGQLGDGTAGNAPDPTPGLIASGATDWTSVSAGSAHTCATRVGRVACWGSDGAGQLGDGTASGTPDPSPGFITSGATDWKRVDAGAFHTCAIRATLLACWGSDANGQLGDGSAGNEPDPIPNLEVS